ncbi:MAG TPA: hypothetical protein VJT75_03925 [Thermoleophilaceae bacterium]|nr:hypothetical protein [Thermoleophilaceae bacterium]
MNLRSRFPLIAGAAALAAVPAVAIAASGTTTVHGPSHPKVNKRFTVRADGTTDKKLVLQVTIHRHGKCKSTYGDDKASGSFVAFSRFVGPGEYDEKRTGLRFTGKTNGNYCAYLGRPSDLTTDPPLDRSTKHFQVVEE